MVATSAARSNAKSGQRKPSAWRGSNGLDSESLSSPPPGEVAHRCALITADGSPTRERKRRIALLAKIWAPTSRCALRPCCKARSGACGGRGNASAETPRDGDLARYLLGQRHQPFAAGTIAEKVRRRRADRGPHDEAQVHAFLIRMDRHRRRMKLVSDGRAAGGDALPCEKLGQAWDVQRISGDQRRRKRKAQVAAECAMLAQQQRSRPRCRRGCRRAQRALAASRPHVEPTTTTTGRAKSAATIPSPSAGADAMRHASINPRHSWRLTAAEGAAEKRSVSRSASPDFRCAASAPASARPISSARDALGASSPAWASRTSGSCTMPLAAAKTLGSEISMAIRIDCRMAPRLGQNVTATSPRIE